MRRIFSLREGATGVVTGLAVHNKKGSIIISRVKEKGQSSIILRTHSVSYKNPHHRQGKNHIFPRNLISKPYVSVEAYNVNFSHAAITVRKIISPYSYYSNILNNCDPVGAYYAKFFIAPRVDRKIIHFYFAISSILKSGYPGGAYIAKFFLLTPLSAFNNIIHSQPRTTTVFSDDPRGAYIAKFFYIPPPPISLITLFILHFVLKC